VAGDGVADGHCIHALDAQIVGTSLLTLRLVPRHRDRRIGERKRLVSEIKAWEKQRNQSGARVKWMFTTERARVKLARAYPGAPKESKLL
jgi:hypothetical protein